MAEQFLRLLHHAGMPKEDADYIHGNGKVVNEILLRARPRATLFTGSGRIAEKLAHDLHGRVRQDLDVTKLCLPPDLSHGLSGLHPWRLLRSLATEQQLRG